MAFKRLTIFVVSIVIAQVSAAMIPHTKECLSQRVDRKENTLTRYVMATKGCRRGEDCYCQGYGSSGTFSTNFNSNNGSVAIKILVSVTGNRNIKNFKNELLEIAEQCRMLDDNTMCDHYSKGTYTFDGQALQFEVETLFPTIAEFEDYADYNKYIPYKRTRSEQLEKEEKLQNACYDRTAIEIFWPCNFSPDFIKPRLEEVINRINSLKKTLPKDVGDTIIQEKTEEYTHRFMEDKAKTEALFKS